MSATLDGASFPNGARVAVDGVHVWTVTAVDAAGNTTTETRTFALDTTAPVITVTGVSDGQLGNQPVAVTFSAIDAHPGTVTATLDGLAFTSGATIAAKGAHVLTVTAIDALWNSSSKTLGFTLDLTAPSIVVTGVTQGELRNTPVTISFSAPTASSLTATLDGAPFASGSTVSTGGSHVLAVTAVDAAGNSASQTTAFTLDFSAPVINISGIISGELRNTPATIAFSASDAHLASVSAVVDSASFISGSTVSTPGDHLLVVTAADGAGNIAVRAVPFSIDVTAPTIVITGVTDGAVRNTAATLSFTSSDTYTRLNNALASGGHQSVLPAPAPCECGFDLTAAGTASASAPRRRPTRAAAASPASRPRSSRGSPTPSQATGCSSGRSPGPTTSSRPSTAPLLAASAWVPSRPSIRLLVGRRTGGHLPSVVNAPRRSRRLKTAQPFSDRHAPESVIGMNRNR